MTGSSFTSDLHTIPFFTPQLKIRNDEKNLARMPKRVMILQEIIQVN